MKPLGQDCMDKRKQFITSLSKLSKLVKKLKCDILKEIQ